MGLPPERREFPMMFPAKGRFQDLDGDSSDARTASPTELVDLVELSEDRILSYTEFFAPR